VRALALAALAVGTLAAAPARAQQAAPARPDEQDMFGGSAPAASSPDGGAPAAPRGGPPAGAPATPVAASSAPPAAAASVASPPPGSGDVSDRDQSLLGGADTPQHLSDYIAPDNPLQIGGQLYLRAQSSGKQGPDAWSLTAPSLLDVYLDARPNPRVRAFVLGRMSFDPTAPPGTGASSLLAGGSGGAFAGTSATGFTTFTTARGPTSILDQMWIRFDVLNRVYVTAGKQHVRWGTGRFWQPTDYLHPIKRNPLDVFDARPGSTMLKLHVPWESQGWNFYGFGVFEDPNQATSTLRQVSGAARAELILLGAEVGLDALVKDGQKPRYGLDVSTGIWELDVYADVGIRYGQDFCAVHPAGAGVVGGGTCPAMGMASTDPQVMTQAAMFDVAPLTGVKVQAVGGINWSHKYNDNDMFTVGGEYFYNQPGYSDAAIYPGLLINSNYTPILNFFYTGRHYAALFASFPAPYSWNLTTFTLSTLANLTDQSFISRVDYSYTLLTHITLEAFAGVHYGHSGGEFRLGFDIAGFHNDPALVDLGLALRLKI
jgi:hypothetical protein